MKKILLNIALILGLIPSTSFVNPSEDDPWILKFEDNFDGNALDTKVWHPWRGVSRDFDFGGTKQWYKPENAVVKDGLLNLIVKKEQHTGKFIINWDTKETKTADFEYTAPDLYTKNTYYYGKYEIRCKIPKGKGLIPAFWLFGSDNHKHNEIDIFEFWNQKNWFKKYSKRKAARVHHMTIHYHGAFSEKNYLGVDYSQDFHVFTLIWEKDKIEWFVDGKLKRRYKRNKKKNLFPDIPMEIRLNIAVQLNDEGPEDNDEFPKTMVVDYVRHWVRKSSLNK